jgi:hypothetical protein
MVRAVRHAQAKEDPVAKVRYIGDEPVTVPELFGHDRFVQPDEVVTVPDERFAAYVCQPRTWQAVEEPADWNTTTPQDSDQPGVTTAPPAAKAPPKKTAATKTPSQKED